MKIAICDKDISVHEMIREYLKRIEIREQLKAVAYFRDEESMLISLKENAYDLFVIEKRIKGIREFGHVFRTRYDNGTPITYEHFRHGILYYWKEFNQENAYYTGYFNRSAFRLKLDDIYYFESEQRETYVFTKNKKRRVNKSLGQEYKKLPEYRFAIISQGLLVNLSHVRVMEKEGISLDNDVTLYPSVRRFQEAKERWNVFHCLDRL